LQIKEITRGNHLVDKTELISVIFSGPLDGACCALCLTIKAGDKLFKIISQSNVAVSALDSFLNKNTT